MDQLSSYHSPGFKKTEEGEELSLPPVHIQEGDKACPELLVGEDVS